MGARAMEARDLGPFFSSTELAAELNKIGAVCGPRTPLEWSRRYPGFSLKIGGRRLFPARIAALLLDGVALADIPARLRQFKQCEGETASPATRRPARRRSRERGARRRV